MAKTKSILLGAKARKAKNRLLIHRKSSQFKDFVKLLRESHARVGVTPKTATEAVAETAQAK